MFRFYGAPQIAFSRDGSGNYSLPQAAFVAGSTIESAKVNSNFSDIASALTASLAKDGQTTPTANLPMGTYKHINVGNATARTNYASAGQVADNSINYAADTGSADAYAIAPSPGISAYTVGQRFTFKVTNANLTTTPTLNVNGLGAGTIVRPNGGALTAGALPANALVEIVVAAATPVFHLQTVAAPVVTGGPLGTPSSGTLTNCTIPASGVSAGAITNGVTATTQAQASNDTKLATDAYVDRVAVQQAVSTITGAVATGTTTIPYDDTIPQNTEGDQYMSLSITPKSATSKLKITVVFNGAHSASPSASSTFSVALFQDSTANALAVTAQSQLGSSAVISQTLVHEMTSGTTSATTFKVRAGSGSAGTTTFNGQLSGRYYGGALASSITIEEIGV